MLTKQQLDGLGLRQTGRDKQGRLIADAAELIEPDPVSEVLKILKVMDLEALRQWMRRGAPR